MKMPERDQAVTVADELLGFGMRVLEELADVVEVLECLPRAAVGSALRQRLGEDERGVGREAVQERWIPLLEEPTPRPTLRPAPKARNGPARVPNMLPVSNL